MAEPDARVKVALGWSEDALELPEHAAAPTTASPARAGSARRALTARRRASRASLRDWPGCWRTRRSSGRSVIPRRCPSRRWILAFEGRPVQSGPSCARQRGPQVKVGVLALQGASARHSTMLARLGAEPVAVRLPGDLDDVDAVVLPGGESTTMSMLLESSQLFTPLAGRLAGGLPAFGTCAGMILLGREILDGRPDQRCFGAVDITVRRNAFGRQVDSFESDLAVAGVGGPPLHAVFIRAPVVDTVGDRVDVLASVDGQPVLCRQGKVLVAAFHPELGEDPRLHELFLNEVV